MSPEEEALIAVIALLDREGIPYKVLTIDGERTVRDLRVVR